VGKSGAKPPFRRPAPHGSEPFPGAKNLPGFGNQRAMTTYEAEAKAKPSQIVSQKIFDEVAVP